jgi:hypothetical protein
MPAPSAMRSAKVAREPAYLIGTPANSAKTRQLGSAEDVTFQDIGSVSGENQIRVKGVTTAEAESAGSRN